MSQEEAGARRRAHTIYLTDELWEEIDRRYHAGRAGSGERTTKIAFIETLLRAGLNAATGGEEHEPARAIRPSAASRSRRGDPTQRLRAASEPGKAVPIPSAARASASGEPPSDQ